MAKCSIISAFLLAALFSTSPTFSQEACPPEGVSLLPHPDCTKYVVCDDGRDSLMSCPPNLYFNAELLLCDFPGNVPECVGGTRPPSGSTAPPTSTTTTARTTERDTTTTTEAPTTTQASTTTTAEPDPTVLTKCGETIVADTGRIEYKFEESYDANEICSFIVRAEHTSSGFVFTLNSHGINATADPSAINIFTFGRAGHIETSHLGPPNPLTETYVSGNIAVVVFKTTGNRGTGFRLSFNAVVSNFNYGTSGVNLIYSNLTGGELTIPYWENPAYMTSVIVLSADHKKIASSFDALRLTFLKENLENLNGGGSCGYDSIRIYSFLSQDVEHKETFCSLLNQKSVYETTGILILVFYDFDSNYWVDNEATFKWEIVRK